MNIQAQIEILKQLIAALQTLVVILIGQLPADEITIIGSSISPPLTQIPILTPVPILNEIPNPTPIITFTPIPTPMIQTPPIPISNSGRFVYKLIYDQSYNVKVRLYNYSDTQIVKHIYLELVKSDSKKFLNTTLIAQEYKYDDYIRNWEMNVNDFEAIKEGSPEYTTYIIKFPVNIEMKPGEMRLLKFNSLLPIYTDYFFSLASERLFPNGPIDLESGLKTQQED